MLFHTVKPPTFSFFTRCLVLRTILCHLFWGLQYFRKRRAAHFGRGGNVIFLMSSFSGEKSFAGTVRPRLWPLPPRLIFGYLGDYLRGRFGYHGQWGSVSVHYDPCQRTPETPSARHTCLAKALL